MSTDIVGKDLLIGDMVVIVEPRYHYMVIGKIIKLTPKGATIEYETDRGNLKTTNRNTHQIVKY